jgi:hypothetical protein
MFCRKYWQPNHIVLMMSVYKARLHLIINGKTVSLKKKSHMSMACGGGIVPFSSIFNYAKKAHVHRILGLCCMVN